MKKSNLKNKIWESREEELYQQGFLQIAGIDEAGCGPLAGPVVAAAVILPVVTIENSNFFQGLDDSKKLSEKNRERLYLEIISHCIYAVGMASPAEIDQLNIRQADYLAMERAVLGLSVKPDALLVDAWHLPFWTDCQYGIPQGDAKIRSIAAASILAKVTRDRIMVAMSEVYPQYGFERHKGYPTKAHYEAIDHHGLCCEHRRSFLKSHKLQ